MSNMDYCKFVNTIDDLKECLSAIKNRKSMNESERAAAKQLILLMYKFLQGEFIIETLTEDLMQDIDDIIDQCKEEEEEL